MLKITTNISKSLHLNNQLVIKLLKELQEQIQKYSAMSEVVTLPEIVMYLGEDIGSQILPSELLQFHLNSNNERDTIELLEYLNRLKYKLQILSVTINDAIKLSNSSLNKKTISNKDLAIINDAKEKLINFLDTHYYTLAIAQSIESTLTICAIEEQRLSQSTFQHNFKNEIEFEANSSKDELKKYQDEIFNRIDIKVRSLDKKLEQLKTEFIHQEERLFETTGELIEKLDKNFSTQQSENLEAVTRQTRTSVNDIQVASQEAANKFHKQVDAQISSITARIEREINEFDKHKQDIEKILGDISNAHQSNANRIQADTEKKVADKLRLWGVVGLISVIFFSLYLFNSYLGFFGSSTTTDAELSTQWFLVRFLTITLLTGPFIYLLKESASHRSKENLYRQRGTQLSSIGAYLSELDLEERTHLKKELARNFFSFHDGKADTNNVPDFLRDMKEMVGIAKSINGQQKTMRERIGRK